MAALPLPAAVMSNEAPPIRTANPQPPEHVHVCRHCADLAADARRREPHERLALRHNVPLVSESAAGVPFSMMTFQCRECGTLWRLYDRANELFVSWVPQWPSHGGR